MITARSFRHGLSIMTFACLLVLAVGSSDGGTGTGGATNRAPVDRWFDGGTLHNATHAQWMAASNRNKLATAGDWLISTKWKGRLNTPTDFDRLKLKAQMLVAGVDGVASVQGTGSMSVTESAAALIAMSNDLAP